MSTIKTEPGRFQVGDWVSFQYGTKPLIARVLEVRGPLGVNRRHLYRVSVSREREDEDTFEMPEDELEKVALPDKEAVTRYFKEGGLVAILGTNLCGGCDQPKVWITLTPRGEVTSTFSEDRGLLGGNRVPGCALYEGKVFTRKENEVASFLTSFGLSPAEAQDVLETVGIAP